MAWRYRNRETKQLVSASTYKRSSAQGGKKFERFSDAKWRVGATRRGKAGKAGKEKSTPSESTSPGSKAPSTPEEFEKRLESELIKKLSKKKRAEFYEEEYEGPEYETGVDY